MPSVKRKRPAEVEDQEEGCLALHCGKFVPWRPTAVLALAATGDGSVVALARESGDIEIWDTEIWHCIKASTPGSAAAAFGEHVSNMSAHSLSWLPCVLTTSSCWCHRELQARRMQP